MTIDKAIDVLKNLAFLSTDKEHEECEKAIQMAIQALTEIQEYRVIGTVEELQALKIENAELHCELQAINATLDLLLQEAREKAIDEFAEQIMISAMIVSLILLTKNTEKVVD